MIVVLLIVVCVPLLFYNGYKYLFDRPENFPPGKMKCNFLGPNIKKKLFLCKSYICDHLIFKLNIRTPQITMVW